MASLMWKPFDLRFHNIIEKLNFHQNVIKEELEFSMGEKLQSDVDKLKEAQEQQATYLSQKEILAKLKALMESESTQSLQFQFLFNLLVNQSKQLDKAQLAVT